MNICDDGHEEIVFEGRECPLCWQLEARKDLEREIKKLKDEAHESLREEGRP